MPPGLRFAWAPREVVVIYRRALDQMPAGAEEIAGALEEGVMFEMPGRTGKSSPRLHNLSQN